MTLQEENEKLRGLLREALHAHRNPNRAQFPYDRITTALSQQAEPAPAQDEREARALFEQMGLIADDEQCIQMLAAALATRPAQTEQQPVAWLPYLSDGADGVTGHYAIARKNPAGYREVWNLRRHHWAAFSDEVLTMDEALAILKKLEMPTAPIAQTAQEK